MNFVVVDNNKKNDLTRKNNAESKQAKYKDIVPSDQGFSKFMQEVNARNEFVFDGVEVTEQDKLLTLSGCFHKYDVDNTGNHRIVVIAKLVDEGTAPIGTITQNPNSKHP